MANALLQKVRAGRISWHRTGAEAAAAAHDVQRQQQEQPYRAFIQQQKAHVGVAVGDTKGFARGAEAVARYRNGYQASQRCNRRHMREAVEAGHRTPRSTGEDTKSQDV